MFAQYLYFVDIFVAAIVSSDIRLVSVSSTGSFSSVFFFLLRFAPTLFVAYCIAKHVLNRMRSKKKKPTTDSFIFHCAQSRMCICIIDCIFGMVMFSTEI